ncbi:hypothetical protein VO54_01044 [Elizabethkingia miricola]|nr:hypothetical protein VO54_01044 [Elizabethkingia miricola]
MRNLIIIVFILFYGKAKFQDKANMMIKKVETKNKKMDIQKPYYTAKLQVQACYYEVFLNDIPVFSYGVKGGMTNEIPLNTCILTSGKQLLKIRLSPMFNNMQLNANTDLSVDFGYSEVIDGKKMSDYVSLGKFQFPKEILEKKIPYYEIELPFDASVSWNYKSILEDAQDLSNITAFLDEGARKFYKVLQSKDSESYFEIMKQSIKMQAEMEYMSKQEVDDLYKETNLSNIKKLYPLGDYDIKFYANGKLVRFVSKKKDENGNQYLFKYTVPPLMLGKQDGEGAFNYLFYLPKGKKQLEVF